MIDWWYHCETEFYYNKNNRSQNTLLYKNKLDDQDEYVI